MTSIIHNDLFSVVVVVLNSLPIRVVCVSVCWFSNDLNSHFWYLDWSINDNKFICTIFVVCIWRHRGSKRGVSNYMPACRFFFIHSFVSPAKLYKKIKFNPKLKGTWLTKWHNERCISTTKAVWKRHKERIKILQFIINKLICYFSALAIRYRSRQNVSNGCKPKSPIA